MEIERKIFIYLGKEEERKGGEERESERRCVRERERERNKRLGELVRQSGFHSVNGCKKESKK